MKKLLFVVLLKLKKLLSVVVEVDPNLWQSSDVEMVVLAHFANLSFCCELKIHSFGFRASVKEASMVNETRDNALQHPATMEQK
jgi:hypothetical protein